MSLLLLFRTGTTLSAATDPDHVLTVPRGANRTVYVAPGAGRTKRVPAVNRTIKVPAAASRTSEVDD